MLAPVIRCLVCLVALAACSKSSPPASNVEVAATSADTQPAALAQDSADGSAGAPVGPTAQSIETPAGVAKQVGDEVDLAGRTLYPLSDCAQATGACASVKALRSGMEGARIVRAFDGPNGPRSILLVQTTTAGNACNGGPLFFVRVGKEQPPHYSDVFDHCGGPSPEIRADGGKVTISVPAHAPNRGSGMIPAKSGTYDVASGALVTEGDSK